MVRTGMSQILDASSARTTDGSLAGLMPTVGGVVNKNEVNCKKKNRLQKWAPWHVLEQISLLSNILQEKGAAECAQWLFSGNYLATADVKEVPPETTVWSSSCRASSSEPEEISTHEQSGGLVAEPRSDGIKLRGQWVRWEEISPTGSSRFVTALRNPALWRNCQGNCWRRAV